MKNLKMFAIAIMAFAVMVMGVHAATCTSTGENCEASVDGTYYGAASDAINAVLADGGTLVLYKDATIGGANDVVAADARINLGEYTLTIDGGSLTVKDGASLRIEGKELVVTNADGGLHVLNGGALTIATGKTTFTTSGTNNTNIYTSGKLEINGEVSTKGNLVNVEGQSANVVFNAKVKNATALVTENASLAHATKTVKATITINGGEYVLTNGFNFTKGESLTVNGGKVTINNDNVIHLVEGTVLIADGELISKTAKGVLSDGTGEVSLTINGGKVVAEGKSQVALYLSNANAKYSVTGGVFEAPDSDAAAYLGTTLKENKDSETVVIASKRGILSGGKYLYNIITDTEDSKGATINLSLALVKEGYTITEEGDYKVISKITPDDQQNTGDEANTPDDTTNPNVPDVPKTNDNILVYASLGLVSALSVGFASKRKENN